MKEKQTKPISTTGLSDQSAGVLVEGRRPETKTPAGAPITPAHPGIDVQVRPKKQQAPRRKFSVEHKLKILEAYDACENSLARGALLRKEGLYHSGISTWRKQRDEGQLASPKKATSSKAAKTNQALSRENERLKKQLAQAEAIIDIQKKVSGLLGMSIHSAQSSEGNS